MLIVDNLVNLLLVNRRQIHPIFQVLWPSLRGAGKCRLRITPFKPDSNSLCAYPYEKVYRERLTLIDRMPFGYQGSVLDKNHQMRYDQVTYMGWVFNTIDEARSYNSFIHSLSLFVIVVTYYEETESLYGPKL